MRRKNNMGNALVLLVGLVTLTGSLLHAQRAPDAANEIEQGLPALEAPPSFEKPPVFEKPPALERPPINDPAQPSQPPMPPMPPMKGEPPKFNPDPSLPFNNGMPPPGMDPALGMDPASKMDNRGPRGGRPSLRDAGMNGAMPSRAGNRAKPADEEISKVAPQNCIPAKGEFIWNFEEEKLMTILRQMSDLRCMNIVVNDSLAENLKMTIIGKKPINVSVAFDILVKSMASKGFTFSKSTDPKTKKEFWSVEKKADSKSFVSPMYGKGNEAKSNEEIGTLFYKVQHTTQDELKNIAKMLISRDGIAEPVGDQFVIVIDTNNNLRRIGTIIEQVDIEDAMNKIHNIKLHNADTKTVERQLKELFDIQSGTRSRRRRPGPGEGKSILNVDKIIADERTNSLIVVADKESVDKLKEVVALIDAADTDKTNKGKIHVRKLKFADAKKIAETLSSVVQQGRGNRYSRRRDDETSELFEGEVKITAHENTNTLVTVASANDYRALSATIDQLDERKEQVYVEAAILDIQVTNDEALGINLFSGLGGVIPGMSDSLGVLANPGGKDIVSGLTKSLTTSSSAADAALGSNSIGALAVLGNFLSGGVAGIVGPSISSTNKIPSFGAVLQALSNNSNVDVLSTPYLLTTDNQEAVMSVGEKVPVLKGASPLGGGLGGGLGITAMQNISYEDVKLTFKITPHVGADNNVRLDISQEVNELGAKQTIMGQDQHSIRTKSATTTLVLKDQQTGVIGGLISHKNRRIDNKVPFLGDIPIFGWLFKQRKMDAERRSLLLIITPYVIKTDDDYRKILDRKLKEREEFARLYYGGKIKNYNPHIEYDRKAGPLSTLLRQMDVEMSKPENGGAVSGEKVIINPKEVPVEQEVKEKEGTSEGISISPIAQGSNNVELKMEPTVYDDFVDEGHFEEGSFDAGANGPEGSGG